ncbi:MAG: LysM peptidoglycan-binding domain-containing protein [Gemmatimonadota bacterium]|nr:LysM peptidoglycan-binding domain-containing protein [Gemmatimonadota bacterium]
MMPYRLTTVSRALAAAAALGAVAPQLASAQDAAATGHARAAAAVVKHTVRSGDTLWDIASHYLKDPHKWPDVFHANTDIVKNPHWIYPGQVLTIDANAVKPEVLAREGDGTVVVAQIQTRAQAPTVFASSVPVAPLHAVRSTTLPPALTVRPGEYESAPFVIGDARPSRAGRVIGPVDIPALGLTSNAGFKLFDRLYVHAGDSDLRVGDFIVVARDTAEIIDIGRVVEPTGLLRVDSLAGNRRAIAVIVRQFGAITSGQRIYPRGPAFEPTTVRPVRGDYPLTAKLLWIQGSPRLPSIQTYVVLGAAEGQGVKSGDQFTLLEARTPTAGRNALIESTATVTIVRVTPLGATGIVVSQTQPELRVGMPTRLSARMP